MKRIQGKKAPPPDIPTASQGDIAFLLIIFFLVGTTFRTTQGLKVVLPDSQTNERILKKRNIEAVWIDKAGKISVSDNLVVPAGVTSVISDKVIANPDLVVLVEADKEVPYGHVTDVLEALKNARALKVIFGTAVKIGGGG